jgi:hypothetical protein
MQPPPPPLVPEKNDNTRSTFASRIQGTSGWPTRSALCEHLKDPPTILAFILVEWHPSSSLLAPSGLPLDRP